MNDKKRIIHVSKINDTKRDLEEEDHIIDEDIDELLDKLVYLNDDSQNQEEYDQVKFKIKGMDELYEQDRINGNAFIITDKVGEIKGVRTENGIYSPKYGSIWEDEDAFKEMYSCDCGKKQGVVYLGEKCPYCNSKVVYRDKNVHMTGYLHLDNYYTIHPTMFKIIGSLIGIKKLKVILYPDWKTEGDGKPIKPVIDENSKNINKYNNIGMIEFYKRFDEIIDFFYNKKKNKFAEYKFIKDNRDVIFTKYIPVESILLRPFSLSDEDYMYDPINRDYTILSSKVYNLNTIFRDIDEENEKIVNKRLYEVQMKIDRIAMVISQGLNKKHGHIRSNIQGGRYNHSTRGVISPMPDGKINEIDFPYLGFLEMYRPEIIYTMTELYGITINQAYTLWQKAELTFDKRVYNIMNYLVENNDLYVLLNRNPTINFGSIMRMKIRKVKKSYFDLVINIPLNVCKAYAADFDGDALQSISLKDSELVDAYELYDPRTHMIISKNDGLFDENFNLIKDQVINLHQFCRLGMQTIKFKKFDKKNSTKKRRKEKKKINTKLRKINIKKIKV